MAGEVPPSSPRGYPYHILGLERVRLSLGEKDCTAAVKSRSKMERLPTDSERLEVQSGERWKGSLETEYVGAHAYGPRIAAHLVDCLAVVFLVGL